MQKKKKKAKNLVKKKEEVNERKVVNRNYKERE